MSITERRTYTRYVFECDNCGVQENVVQLDEEPNDSPHQLPTLRGWIPVPLLPGSFFLRNIKNPLACSRRCADAITAQALDEAVA